MNRLSLIWKYIIQNVFKASSYFTKHWNDNNISDLNFNILTSSASQCASSLSKWHSKWHSLHNELAMDSSEIFYPIYCFLYITSDSLKCCMCILICILMHHFEQHRDSLLYRD